MVSNKKVGEYRPPLKILVTGIDFYGLFYENEVENSTLFFDTFPN